MENTSRNLGKYGREDGNTVLYAIESLESEGQNLVSERYRRNSEPRRTLILNIRRLRASVSCRELFLHNLHGSYNRVPKHITTIDEKYVLCCLELIRNCAIRAAASNFTQKVGILSDHTSSSAKMNRSSNKMAIEYPLGVGTEVIGSISDSPAMINILKSPLLQQFGSIDGSANVAGNEAFFSNYVGPLREPTSTLSRKSQNDVEFLHGKYASSPLHKRDASSISSSNSSFSDQSSSSPYGTSFQGMLQCTWKGGLPHHVFTVDDKKEVYIGNLTEADSSDDKDLDYFYTFLSRSNGKKDTDITELELESVAKMRVSTSITFSSDNSEVRETRFVLSILRDNRAGEKQSLNRANKKNRRLTRKVVDVFRPGHYHKQRSSTDPSEDVHNNIPDQDDNCAENNYAPNLELAAIIFKEISHNRKEVELGGWGLKFLKKTGSNVSLEATLPSESSRSTGECSTSMDILIPAGFHGGPRTRDGGPSTLIERWSCGGHCDCGGWDIGCPLTILSTKSDSTDCSSQADNSGECKSVDLFMQGSKQKAPIMKMVNIHKGLYYIHFQSTLSTLQSFAVAAAIIHSRSPVLRSKVYRR